MPAKPLVQQITDVYEEAIQKMQHELARPDRNRPGRCNGKHGGQTVGSQWKACHPGKDIEQTEDAITDIDIGAQDRLHQACCNMEEHAGEPAQHIS